ncbi:MAG: hypothetical protein ACJAUG_001268 [Halioglobus sp.]|jgi:hypothetical protein
MVQTHDISDQQIMTNLAKTVALFCFASAAMAVAVWYFVA